MLTQTVDIDGLITEYDDKGCKTQQTSESI